jgi:hypothetical protein
VAFDDPGFYWSVFAKLLSYVDGSWVDICSIIMALVIVARQWLRRPAAERGPFMCRDMGVEFVNAASIFPLLLLSLSIVSSKFTEALLNGNKITLSIAGGFALFALLEDRQKSADARLESTTIVVSPSPPAANSPIAHGAPFHGPLKPPAPKLQAQYRSPKKRRKSGR